MKHVASLPEITFPLHVNVTPALIAQAVAVRGGLDPIHLALRASVPGTVRIIVSSLAVVFTSTTRGELEVLRVDLPEDARAFVLRFDTRQRLEPLEFDLCLPQ